MSAEKQGRAAKESSMAHDDYIIGAKDTCSSSPSRRPHPCKPHFLAVEPIELESKIGCLAKCAERYVEGRGENLRKPGNEAGASFETKKKNCIEERRKVHGVK